MFDTPIHWVKDIDPIRLGLMSRPRGGELLCEDVAAWRIASVRWMVSLLESHEIRDLELKAEPVLCEEAGIGFLRLPIPDREVPRSMKEFAMLIDELHAKLIRGEAVVIHCRAGIGRTGLVAGCVLHRLGVRQAEIFHSLSRSRGVSVPDTSVQIEWVENYSAGFPNAVDQLLKPAGPSTASATRPS